MKNTYFNTLYLIALSLLGLLFFLSISITRTEGSGEVKTLAEFSYSISPWGVVIGGLMVGMLLMYFQVRRKFRNRFPKS